MHWLERLHRGPGRIALGGGRAELILWAYFPHLPDNAPHRHTYFEVCQVGGYGEGLFIVEGVEHLLRPGDLFFARPGVLHQFVNTAVPLMEMYWVAFQWVPDPSDRCEVARLMNAFAESSMTVVTDDRARVRSLWAALRAVCEGPPLPGHEEQMEGLAATLLLAIAQAGAGIVSSAAGAGDAVPLRECHSAAQAAVRYIHDNIERSLTVREVADYVCLSPRHFCRLFKRFAGVSPNAYVTRARMDRARSLLLHTSDSIREVAAAVGYDDVHYFTRLFTRHFHQSPGSYRRRPGNADVRSVQKVGALV